jgi:hypothetical protein
MDNPEQTPFDQELSSTLRRGRSVAVAGFADRVVGAVRAERRRRNVVRWGSALAAAAAVFVALLTPPAASEEALNRQTFELVARDESAQLADLFGAADDLSLLAPVAERPAVVETFVAAGS